MRRAGKSREEQGRAGKSREEQGELHRSEAVRARRSRATTRAEAARRNRTMPGRRSPGPARDQGRVACCATSAGSRFGEFSCCRIVAASLQVCWRFPAAPGGTRCIRPRDLAFCQAVIGWPGEVQRSSAVKRRSWRPGDVPIWALKALLPDRPAAESFRGEEFSQAGTAAENIFAAETKARGRSPLSHETCDMGHGIWDMGYGIWDMGYGTWAPGSLRIGIGIWQRGQRRLSHVTGSWRSFPKIAGLCWKSEMRIHLSA